MDPIALLGGMVAVLLALMVLGVPVAIALGVTSLIAYVGFADLPPATIAQKFYFNLSSFPLMAVPFFLLSTGIMQHGGVAKRVINMANQFVGSLPGGLAMTSILSCMLFASISGSSVATVAAIGGIMIPAMLEAGYDKRFAVGSIVTAGTLGILIPPSIPMIIYGFVTSTSVSKLFIAGILPGIFLGSLLMAVTYVYARRKGYARLAPSTWRQKWQALREGFWALLLPLMIIVGVYGLPPFSVFGIVSYRGGAIFTPTEAAVVSVFLAIFVSVVVYREISPRDVVRVIGLTAPRIGIIMFIVTNAVLFGFILNNYRIPQIITEKLVSFNLSPELFLLMVNVLLFFAGDFMDAVPIILIFIPVLFPPAMALGIDPIHFGIMVVVNMEMGAVTPPVGMNLYMASTITGMKLYDVLKAAAPWILVVVLALLVITYVPQISLFLPGLMYGR